MESSFCGMRARPIPQAIGALESWMSRNGSVLSIFQTKTLLWMTPFSLASPNKKADSVIKRYPALLRQLNHTISGQSRRQSHEDSRNDHMQRAPILTIHQTRTPDIHGSALLASLIMTAILSMALASYLSLSQKQSVSVARSQAWNAAIPVAESGVEEALAQLNRGEFSCQRMGTEIDWRVRSATAALPRFELLQSDSCAWRCPGDLFYRIRRRSIWSIADFPRRSGQHQFKRIAVCRCDGREG